MASSGSIVILAVVCYIGWNTASAALDSRDVSNPGEEVGIGRHARFSGPFDAESINSLSSRRVPPTGQKDVHHKYLQTGVYPPPDQWSQRLGLEHAARRARSPETRDLDYHEEEREDGEEREEKVTSTTPRVVVTVFPPYRERFPEYPKKLYNPKYLRYPAWYPTFSN